MTASMLANHVWQSTIVAGLAWLITIALRRNRAGARYGVWLAASLKFLVPFAVLVSAGSSLGWRTAPVATQPQMAHVMDAIGQPFSASPAYVDTVAPVASGLEIPRPVVLASLLVVWLAGCGVVAVTWFVRWRRVSAVVRDSVPMSDGPLVDALRRLEQDAGITTPIVLLASDSSLEPGVFGIRVPVLLWPRRISEHLDVAQIDAILAHEVSHVRRRDNLAAMVHMTVQSIFWFHPLVWWIGSRLVDERERACDEDVMRLGSEPQTYAESILKTCQMYVESPLECVAGVTGSDLKKRIEHIMNHDAGTTLNLWKKTLLAATVAAAIAGPVAVGVLSAPPLRAQSQADEAAEVIRLRVVHAALLRKEIELRLGVLAQSTAAEAAKPPAFDVTSVKPNNSGEGRITMLPAPGGGWRATNMTLGMLVRIAFQVQDNQIVGGPKWLFSDRFDVLGSGSAPGRDGAMFPKLKTLLADRFSLVTHTETRELTMFALVFAGRDGKIGPKMQPSTAADCPTPLGPGARGNPPPPGPMSQAQMQRCGISIGPGRLSAGNLSMAQLAANLSRVVGTMVVDRTNLAGNFELTLEYAPDPGMAGRSDFPAPPPGAGPDRPAVDGPSIFSALQEQLGLKLESTKGPVDVLVIDSAEKPSAD